MRKFTAHFSSEFDEVVLTDTDKWTHLYIPEKELDYVISLLLELKKERLENAPNLDR